VGLSENDKLSKNGVPYVQTSPYRLDSMLGRLITQ